MINLTKQPLSFAEWRKRTPHDYSVACDYEENPTQELKEEMVRQLVTQLINQLWIDGGLPQGVKVYKNHMAEIMCDRLTIESNNLIIQRSLSQYVDYAFSEWKEAYNSAQYWRDEYTKLMNRILGDDD